MAGTGDTSRTLQALMDLQGLIQSISQNRRNGALTVSQGPEFRRLRFNAGNIIALTGQRPDQFTRALCWAGVVTRAQINTVIQTLGETAGPEDLLSKLLTERIIAPEAVLDALDCMIEEEITLILGWKNPQVTFSDSGGSPDPFAEAQIKVGVSIAPGGLLLEGMRRQDELGTVAPLIPHQWDTLVRDPAVAPPDTLSADARLLLGEWRDGVVSGSLFEHPRLPPFRATMAVALLRRTGVVRISTAQELLVQADAAKAAGTLKKALGLYRHALELGQDVPRVHLQIAELAERFGDRTGAAQACLAAAAQLSDPAAAAQALSTALRLGADREQPLSQLVAIHIQLDQSDQAVSCLLELAKMYEKRRSFEQAIQAVREAQELGADPAAVALLLARVAVAQGDGEQAVLQLEVAARAFHESERLDESVSAWKELLRLAPGRCDYAMECAELMMWTGDRAGAVVVLRATLGKQPADASEDSLLPMYELLAKLDPSDVSAHDWLAKAYERRRDRDGATAQLRLAAAAQEKSGDHRRLVETLERILELDGQQADILDWMARARMELGQDGAAAQAWAKAADLTLARGGRKEVRAMLEGAVQRLPGSSGLRLRLAQIANRDGDRESALKHFRAAADLASGSGELAVARDALLQLSRLRPDDVLVRVRLVECTDAIKGPDLDRILAELVRVAIRTNNLGLALEHARRRVDLGGDELNWEARSELVELLRRTGDHNAELIAGRDLVGRVLASGDNDHAVELLSRLVASHSKDADLVLQLAEAHNALGNAGEAVRLFRQSVCLLQVDNRLTDAKTTLGSLIQIDEEAEAVAMARTWLDAGQIVDWEKIRMELAQRRRLERGTDGLRRPPTDRSGKPGTGNAQRPSTDRAGTDRAATERAGASARLRPATTVRPPPRPDTDALRPSTDRTPRHGTGRQAPEPDRSQGTDRADGVGTDRL